MTKKAKKISQSKADVEGKKSPSKKSPSKKSLDKKSPIKNSLSDNSLGAGARKLKPSRAFIIGDRDLGLTVVITDPVLVVHYSAAELKEAAINAMSGEEPIVSMAAVVKDLVPHLRGVDVVQLRARLNDIQNDRHGDFSLAQEEEAFAEAEYAKTIGRIIKNGGNVCDVDFCIAMDVDPAEIVARGRNTEPAMHIADYLETNSTKPKKYQIGNLGPGEIDPLDPWPP